MLHIPQTHNTPEVRFDFARRLLELEGESYPESAAAFYGEIITRTRDFLHTLNNDEVHVRVRLAYFNSSSTKMLFGLFDSLNDAALRGNRVHLEWLHDVEDDTILEFGLELAEDFPAIEFTPRALEGQ
jgi:hypothetical protein